MVARAIGQKSVLGQQVIIENKGGAAHDGSHGGRRAPPDGYTLMVAKGPFTINPTLYGKGKPLRQRKDFVPVSGLRASIRPSRAICR